MVRIVAMVVFAHVSVHDIRPLFPVLTLNLNPLVALVVLTPFKDEIKIKSKIKIKNSLTRPPAVNGYENGFSLTSAATGRC